MLLGIEVALELLLPRAVRAVVVRPALLVLDDLTLVVEVLLAERVEQRSHPVGLEPQRELELVRGKRLEVVRPVEPGRAVHRPAGGLDERDVLGLADVRRALEHHVLEEVREAGLARLLVLRSDVVPDVDRHDRRQVVLGDDQAEAVREALVGEGNGGNGGRQGRSSVGEGRAGGRASPGSVAEIVARPGRRRTPRRVPTLAACTVTSPAACVGGVVVAVSLLLAMPAGVWPMRVQRSTPEDGETVKARPGVIRPSSRRSSPTAARWPQRRGWTTISQARSIPRIRPACGSTHRSSSRETTRSSGRRSPPTATSRLTRSRSR